MQVVSNIVIPAVVFFAMWVVGLELTTLDFRRVTKQPKIIAIGLLSPLIIFPLVAGIVIIILRPPDSVATGIILIAAAPGAAISNLFARLARANIALSVVLTASSIILGFITYPVLTRIGMQLFQEGQQASVFPYKQMIMQLLLVMLLPIVLGMITRWLFSDFAVRNRQILSRVSVLGILGIIVFIAVDQFGLLIDQLASLVWISGILTLSTMAIGYGLAWLIGAPRADRIVFLIEFSSRNSAIAMVVAVTTFGSPDYAVLLVAYFIIQALITFGVLIVLRDRSG